MIASAARTSFSSIWKSSLMIQLLSFPFSRAVEHAPHPIQRPIFNRCVLINLISASGYASRAPYSASFVRMSQFAFFFPNDKPKIFIVLSLSLFILTLASMITDPDIVYVFKYKSASLRRLPFFCRLSSLKNDLSFHFSFYHKNMRSKLHL